jgi:serine/threonine-protein kinase
MGEVYLAEHLALQKRVAVKVLSPKLVSSEHIERFLREARTCSRIEHQNVVSVYDVGSHDGIYYIVMQYIQGKTLTELLQDQGGPLPWRSGVRLVQLAATGLHAVHSCGLVHRDIKPSNIMLSVDSRVVLMDFGLVREESDSGLTRTGNVVGTPTFMSPEQCRGKPLDRRSDIYSLGSTLYCLLSGQPPFQGNVVEVLTQIAAGKHPKPLCQLRPEISQDLSDLVAKAMAPRPEDRFSRASLMARELKTPLRAAMLRETASWRTAELSASNVDTQAVSQLVPLELLPLETRAERLRRQLPWISAIAAVVVCFLLLGLLLRASNRTVTPDHADGVGKPLAADAATIRSQTPFPDPERRFENMVFIEAGYARLGNSVEQLKRHFQSVHALVGDSNLMQQAITAATEESVQRVFVPAFWIDKYEVTNAAYASFLRATGYKTPEGWEGVNPPAGKEDHPVHNILHRDAEAYAAWAKKKLPTREQWMRAFRGDSDALFPWGDTFDSARANVLENKAFASTSPVDATPRDVSPFGVFNLEGNVCEYLREKTTVLGQSVVFVKGAHFNASGQIYGIGCMQVRLTEDVTSLGFGFRCVVEEPEAEHRERKGP